MGAMSKHVLSYLISQQENDIVKEVLGQKRYSLASAIVQVVLALPPDRNTWVKYATGIGCLVKDGTTRSYYIRIVDIASRTIVWEQELYRQFKYRAVTSTFHTFNAHDCRAGLNFTDEQEAQLFRAAVKERIRDFRRKRDEHRARKMARYNAAMMNQPIYAPVQMYRVQTASGQTAIYQVPAHIRPPGGASLGKGKGRIMSPQMRPQMQGMRPMSPQMGMQGMRPMGPQMGMQGQRPRRPKTMRPRPRFAGPPMGRGQIQGPPQPQWQEVPQTPMEEPSIYAMVDHYDTTPATTPEKKKKKGGFFSFLKRKKNDQPISQTANAARSSQMTSPYQPTTKKDRGEDVYNIDHYEAAELTRPTWEIDQPATKPSLLPSKTVSKAGTVSSSTAPPPPPPPPPPCAPPPPKVATPMDKSSLYGSSAVVGDGAAAGSLMDGILAGTNKLKKVDQSALIKQKPEDIYEGVGGALARAMDLRSKVMHSSDEDDDDDDDDYWEDEGDDDEWSDQ